MTFRCRHAGTVVGSVLTLFIVRIRVAVCGRHLF